ncbi:GlmU family protein [Fulvivirga sediminis]|uniref:GlmU family protein n=1 Tax=Fulvivirga sediminis TaxID=2803949 RepID=A0A937JZL3_9BACT|nr:GlmU family protein [Fulvivirga sediminis]MBL3656769.1 GlmU family protein [Fulvivirga sediminis]
MNVILFDEPTIRLSLLPFTFTRPVSEIRVGILTISEKWARRLKTDVSFSTEAYLSEKFPLIDTEDNLWINGAVCPDEALLEAILSLSENTLLTTGEQVIAAKVNQLNLQQLDAMEKFPYDRPVTIIGNTWEIFKKNAEQIRADFDLITHNRTSADIIDPHTIVYGEENVFIEEGATIKAAVINAEKGPIYIGKNTEVSEGAMIRGAFSLGEGSVLSMGAKIRGDSSVGPYCKVGGEVSNSVIFGYSNKGHEGYIGNTVIGEWCNLGADTNTSNLKNNYTPVRLWSYKHDSFSDTGETFCGMMMGDHSKCGINTMFNTGTVVGVSCNIFGAGQPRNFIPSFTWGGATGLETYRAEKACEVAEKVMERRQIIFDKTERDILDKVFELTAKYRTWEKE